MPSVHKSILLFLFGWQATFAWADPTAYRGQIAHFITDPAESSDQTGIEYLEDGLLIINDGKIVQLGAYDNLRSSLTPDTKIMDYSGHLIMPGFIDTHIHYPQQEMIAAYGEQLLEWLNTYTFPTERKYSNYQYARQQARLFIKELLRNGTTTALTFATVHPESTNALFEEALSRDMRLIAGKVMMDRNAPDYLLDTAESSYQQTKDLIKKWHGRGRLLYAITPRFAPTSTPAQLTLAGQLKSEFPTVYVHTHLSENLAEIAWARELFPERSGYLDIYDYYGLTGSRSIFAHSIHISNAEMTELATTQSVVSFCPTSNLFLGSGLFNLKAFRSQGIRIGLGTDIGAGTSFSMLSTLNESYKIAQLQKQKLSPWLGFYLATLGGARALSLDQYIGNFLPGKEADFVILNLKATPLMSMRYKNSKTLQDKLFMLMTLGDDRSVAATYIRGKLAYKSDNKT